MTLSKEQFLPGTESAPRRRSMSDYRKVAPPAGYYTQPEGVQGVLPGMRMTQKQHLAALGAKHGLDVKMTREDDNHVIELYEPDRDRKINNPPTAVLEWAARDSHPQWNAPPGEIGMVHTMEHRERQGIAGDILRTAEKIAHEGGKVSVPKHSSTRSTEGVQWSRARMRERGQQVW